MLVGVGAWYDASKVSLEIRGGVVGVGALETFTVEFQGVCVWVLAVWGWFVGARRVVKDEVKVV